MPEREEEGMKKGRRREEGRWRREGGGVKREGGEGKEEE